MTMALTKGNWTDVTDGSCTAESASVLIVTRRYPPEMLGGVESRFQAMADTASELGHRVRVLVTEGSSSSVDEGSIPIVSGLGWQFDGTWHPRRMHHALVRVLKSTQKPTVAWVANPQFVVSLKTVWPDVPVVLMPGQVRQLDIKSCLRRLKDGFQRAGGRFAVSWALRDVAFWMGIRQCDLLAVPCHHQKAVITSGLSWVARRTRVLSRGIQTKAWHHCRRKRSAAGDEPLNLLVACRLDPLKNLPMAVRAVERVVRNGNSIQLRIVGSGPEESAIRQLANSLKLDKHVQFFPMTTEIKQHYHWADAFVMCSDNELFGNTVLEALSAGVPVLLRENAPPDVVIGCWDRVHDCPAVISFPSEGELGLAEAIQRLKSTPDYLAQVSNEASDWSERLDWRYCLSEYINPMSSVICEDR